ncbi:RREB1-like protein [Mya arenaria]|uniref:RREB1-like protein n=1 Tax=Mya arenaria TaxID=6604 RepID=A0ABY7F7J9_MYAAR|nr:RREB1-like protein [Mya arenaria]
MADRKDYRVRRHMKSHTGERRFVCEICDKAFLLKHHLKNHQRNVHNKIMNDEKTYGDYRPVLKYATPESILKFSTPESTLKLPTPESIIKLPANEYSEGDWTNMFIIVDIAVQLAKKCFITTPTCDVTRKCTPANGRLRANIAIEAFVKNITFMLTF